VDARAKQKRSLVPSKLGQDQGQPSVVVLPERDATSFASISLRLLGSPHVLTEDKRLDLTPQKPILFLLYLAIKHDWVTRDELGVVFYPEDDEASARHNLRVLINRAKTVTWSEGLEVDQHRLRWLVPSDVLRVREAVANRAWESVFRLHQHPLLSDFTLEAAPGFEAWLEMEREALLTLWRKAGLEHAQNLSKNAKHSVATEVLERLLQHDTLAEDTLAFYLEQAYLSGKRDEALKTYQHFKTTLKGELGLDPLESTERLASTIRRSASLAVTATQTQTESRPMPLSLRRPPRLVAREAEQEHLLNSQTPITLILGEPGVGKTRVLQDTLPAALWLRCLEGLAVPYYPLLELIRANIARLPDLAYYKGDLARLLPELSPQQTPIALEPNVAKARLLEALAFVLEAFHQPLVLDDLQWCDVATLEVFIFLASRRRVRLYATCRKGELDTALQSTLATLRGQDLLTEIELGPFDQQAIKKLLADLAGISEGPQKFSDWLFARSSGNVLFALETLKNLFEQGILQERDGTWHSDLDGITRDYSELSVPPKVAELLERRLRSMSRPYHAPLFKLVAV
jgi:DNA-binding SARP family transcriptional activator